MSIKFNMDVLAGKKILVAPLDWGLGHATRCIPVIKALIKSKCTIWLAGEGEQVVLLSKEFPQLPVLYLRGYRIRYAASVMTGKILWQIPKILAAIRKENNWLNEQVEKYQFDFVISDNRYGLYHPDVHSVFITHQLLIKTALGKWSEKILQTWNYKFINRFDECWIPDEEGELNYAGILSHPQKLPSIPIKYTGIISRLEKKSVAEQKDHLLIILSGPEPQRSLLENKIIKQLADYPGTATLIRGLPASTTVLPSLKSITFYNHLPAKEMNEEIAKAAWVIGRSGYSTIMDLVVMKKKSILIPTPGQTEQEYLAGYLMKKKFAYCVNQKKFALLQSVENAKTFPYIINT